MAVVNQVGNALTGSTGSGAFLGSNTGTLITPVLGAATGTSINLGSSTTINGFIDDDTFATASATKGATSESIKAYIDAQAGATITSWVAYTPTFTGYGTPSSVEFWSRRVGDMLEVRGRFTCGTNTAVEARITLGYNGTNANVNSSGTVITTIECVGSLAYSSAEARYDTVLIESNVGYMTFGAQIAGASGLSKSTGSGLYLNSSSIALFAAIPVTTWP